MTTYITVLAHARVPSPESADEIDPDAVIEADLVGALRREWPTDAHITQYAPVRIPCEGAPSGRAVVRLTHDAIGEVDPPPQMVALIGDVDPPGHDATPGWRAEIEPRLAKSGLAWYRTRNGARVVATLPEPFEIASQQDAADWRDLYLGWREHLAAEHKISIDRACSDWTRIFRLPNVRRDGQVERAELHSRPPTFDPDRHWREPAQSGPAPASPRQAVVDAPELARAHALAERLEPSVEGHGGDESLLKAATELATILGEDATAIESVLVDVFNPRCAPPWPAKKIALEARRAAERQADPMSRYLRRRDAAWRADWTRPAAENATDLGRPVDLSTPDEPLAYTVAGLCIAPSDGKISIIAGQPGGAKGPIADHIAACVALGEPVFGAHVVSASRVLLLDCEGARLTKRRLRRFAVGLDRDPAELAGRIHLHDARGLDLLDPGTLANLADFVADRDIDVIVLDSYTSAMLRSGIDANLPEFAALAQALGELDRTVVAVAHANKAAAGGGTPRLADVAYSGALASMAQTAIVVHYPDLADQNTVRVACARAPEEGFAAHVIRFSDEPEDGLSVAVVADDGAETGAKLRARLAETARLADLVEAAINTLDRGGEGVPAKAVRELVATTGRPWQDALAECYRRGTIEAENDQYVGTSILRRVRSEDPA